MADSNSYLTSLESPFNLRLQELLTEYGREFGPNLEGVRLYSLASDIWDAHLADLSEVVTEARLKPLQELRSWIALNHLGDGFDGEDRWEHCAAEIMQHIDQIIEAQ